jgi:putative ABC transport system permease protein
MPSVFDFQKVPKSGVVFWQVLGRLRPGVGFTRARAMFLAETEQRNPGLRRRASGGIQPMLPELLPLRDQLFGPVRRASVVLLGIVGFVLLIACANVAHLLLSRFAERRQELAIRAALGASRARLTQQLITECTLLTLMASAAGLGIAYWAAHLAAAVQPPPLAARDYTVVDGRVLAFAISLAVVTGILFGVLPAILLGRLQAPAEFLRPRANRIRATLVGMQAALTLVLLAGSLLTGRTFLRLLHRDLGFHTDHLVTLNVSLSGTRYAVNEAEPVYYQQALDRLRALPGVESAAAAQFLPLVAPNMYMGQEFRLNPKSSAALATTLPVTPGYFRTLGTRVLEGREFGPGDTAGSERVVVVNQALAKQLGFEEHIVGKKLLGWRDSHYTVVGVVVNEYLSGPATTASPLAYFPADQWTPGSVTFVARVRAPAESYLAICRDALRQLDPQVPVYDLKTLDQRLFENMARPRFYTTAILFFAAFALVLAGIGVYGMASYAVAQRTHEIGVRIAVGAKPSQVRWLLAGQVLLPLVLGLALGAAASLALPKPLQSLIPEVPALDLATCTGAALLLSFTGILAVWTATRKISGLDPASILRAE